MVQAPSTIHFYHRQPIRVILSICLVVQPVSRPMQKHPTIYCSWAIHLPICLVQRQVHQHPHHNRLIQCGWGMVGLDLRHTHTSIDPLTRVLQILIRLRIQGFNGTAAPPPSNSFVSDSNFSSVFGASEPAGMLSFFLFSSNTTPLDLIFLYKILFSLFLILSLSFDLFIEAFCLSELDLIQLIESIDRFQTYYTQLTRL